MSPAHRTGVLCPTPLFLSWETCWFILTLPHSPKSIFLLLCWRAMFHCFSTLSPHSKQQEWLQVFTHFTAGVAAHWKWMHTVQNAREEKRKGKMNELVGGMIYLTTTHTHTTEYPFPSFLFYPWRGVDGVQSTLGDLDLGGHMECIHCCIPSPASNASHGQRS